jgi:hypothetical protein
LYCEDVLSVGSCSLQKRSRILSRLTTRGSNHISTASEWSPSLHGNRIKNQRWVSDCRHDGRFPSIFITDRSTALCQCPRVSANLFYNSKGKTEFCKFVCKSLLQPRKTTSLHVLYPRRFVSSSFWALDVLKLNIWSLDVLWVWHWGSLLPPPVAKIEGKQPNIWCVHCLSFYGELSTLVYETFD